MEQIECYNCGGFKNLKVQCDKCKGTGYLEVESKQAKPSEYWPDGIIKVDPWDKSL